MPWRGATGMTMVEHTVATVASRCAPVFVVAAPGQVLPDLEAVVLHDEMPGLGPLPATARGLSAAAAAGAEWAFVSAVDMPYLSGALLDQLIGHLDADVVLPWDGREHYLAGVYRTTLSGPISDLVATGRRSMRSIVEDLGAAVRRVTPADPRALTNLNAPEDLVPDDTDE